MVGLADKGTLQQCQPAWPAPGASLASATTSEAETSRYPTSNPGHYNTPVTITRLLSEHGLGARAPPVPRAAAAAPPEQMQLPFGVANK